MHIFGIPNRKEHLMIDNSNLSVPGSATAKALGILFYPPLLRNLMVNTASELEQEPRVTLTLAQPAESHEETPGDEFVQLPDEPMEEQVLPTKAQGMVHHLKHTKNKMSLN